MSDTVILPGGSPIPAGDLVATDQETIFGDGSVQNPLTLAGTGPGAPTPAFESSTVTIYARPAPLGSDTTGNGTFDKPYETFQHAVRFGPLQLPPGQLFDINITGITEALPIGYILPAWKAPQTFQVNFGQFGPIFPVKFAYNIVADLEPVPLSPASDASIDAPGDFIATNDAVTDMITLTLTGAPRPSWAANALAGKQLIGTGGPFDTCTIYESSATFIRITNTSAPSTPMQIVQPSATLTSVDDSFNFVIQVLNCDSIGFAGVRISTSPFAFAGLFVDGCGNAGAQCCELDSPAFVNVASDMARVAKCWVKGFPFFAATGSGMFFSGGFMDGIVTSFPFIGLSTPVVHFENMVYDGCDPIEPVFAIDTFQPAAVANFSMTNTLIRNGLGDGIIFHGAYGQLDDCDIYDCTGNGITVDQGAGLLRLNNVQSSGAANGNFGIQVDDGMQVKVDAATSGAATPLLGDNGAMQVGDFASPRSWADFVNPIPPSGHPQFNEYNITAAAATGATGTGSRLSQ